MFAHIMLMQRSLGASSVRPTKRYHTTIATVPTRQYMVQCDTHRVVRGKLEVEVDGEGILKDEDKHMIGR